MSKTVILPVIKIGNENWIRINFTKVVKIHAVDIKCKKKRVSEPSGHKFDEAIAEGSVKLTSKKEWDLQQFLSKIES